MFEWACNIHILLHCLIYVPLFLILKIAVATKEERERGKCGGKQNREERERSGGVRTSLKRMGH